MRCDVGHRCGSDPVLLWLWCRLEAAALIGPLAWEIPYVTGTAERKGKERKKERKKEKKRKKRKRNMYIKLSLKR